MIDSLSLLFSCFMSSFLYLFLPSLLLKKKGIHKHYKFYIFLLILIIYLFSMYILIHNFVRIILNCLFATFIIKKYYKTSWNMATFLSAVITISVMVAELLFGLVFFGILGFSIEEFKNLFFLNYVANIAIFIIDWILFIILKKIPQVDKLMEFIDKKINKYAIFYCLLILATLSILLNVTYFKFNPFTSFVLYTTIIIFYAIMLLSLIKEKQENIKSTIRFEAALKELSEYEKVLDEQRSKAHDNNNDWISVRGMLKDTKANIEAIEYIEQVLKDNKKTDKSILNKTASIPYGGLQGLVYKKFLKMKEKGINYSLNLSKDLKNKKLSKFDAEKNKNICTIIGILLDNAIEAAEISDSKEVSFSMYTEDGNLSINISNTYKGTIDLSKMDVRKYSTKGSNRGYGLSNVKEIVDKTDYITNERGISGKYFIQIVKIKM